MKQVLTIVVKLQPTPEQAAKIEATLQAFAAACNYVNEHTDPKLTNKIAIQSLTYQTIKSEFNLVANMAVRACARGLGSLLATTYSPPWNYALSDFFNPIHRSSRGYSG